MAHFPGGPLGADAEFVPVKPPAFPAETPAAADAAVSESGPVEPPAAPPMELGIGITPGGVARVTLA